MHYIFKTFTVILASVLRHDLGDNAISGVTLFRYTVIGVSIFRPRGLKIGGGSFDFVTPAIAGSVTMTT